MRERSRRRRPRHSDPDKLPRSIAETATGNATPESGKRAGKNPAAVALGRLGGRKGGPARAAKLTPQQRRDSARKAARARWSKEHPPRARTRKEGE